MDTRKVYRYEDKYGHGPYNSECWSDEEQQEFLLQEHTSTNHPTWLVDAAFWCGASADMIEPNAYETDFGNLSACASREALSEWFAGWEDVLAENGFRVVEYEVPSSHVIDGASGKQVSFRP